MENIDNINDEEGIELLNLLAIVPPFEAPTTEEANRILRSRLVAAPSLT